MVYNQNSGEQHERGAMPGAQGRRSRDGGRGGSNGGGGIEPCLVCKDRRPKVPPSCCPSCVRQQLRALSSMADSARRRALEARERLNDVLERASRSQNRRQAREVNTVKRRTEILQDKCSAARDAIFEQRIDAADMRYRIMEASHRINQAWHMLMEKHRHVSQTVIQPIQSALQHDLSLSLTELAALRRQKVIESVSLFQVDISSEVPLIQGLPLPRYLHSFNNGGSAAECSAMTQLARLTGLIAKLLDVELPFLLDFRPSHCNILGAATDGHAPLALSPPARTAATASSTTSVAVHSAAGEATEDGTMWLRNYRRALFRLSLNVRHLVLTQMEAGSVEEHTYRRACAANDISPAVTLRTLVALSTQPLLGFSHGANCNCDYAFALENRFDEHVSAASVRIGGCLPVRSSISQPA